MTARVAVVGGGIAGCSAAFAFARRGIAVTLVEREPRIAAAASGNAAGLLMPWVARVAESRTRLSLAGFEFTRSLALSLEERGIDTGLRREGALRFANTERLQRLHADCTAYAAIMRPVDAHEASRIAGIEVAGKALHFPTACTLSPPALCNAMVATHGDLIDVRTHAEAISIECAGGEWNVAASNGTIVEAETLVLAAANDCARFDATRWLPLEPVRGQVVHLDGGHPALDGLRTALCSDGYVARSPSGGFVVGASFEHGDASRELDNATQAGILRALKETVPAFDFDASASWPGRVAFRCSAPDHMPIAGPVANFVPYSRWHMTVRYAQLKLTGKERWWLPNLYVTTAHASHGLVTAPLAGELIAAAACGEPRTPEAEEMLKSTNALRFLVAKLNRESGKTHAP